MLKVPDDRLNIDNITGHRFIYLEGNIVWSVFGLVKPGFFQDLTGNRLGQPNGRHRILPNGPGAECAAHGRLGVHGRVFQRTLTVGVLTGYRDAKCFIDNPVRLIELPACHLPAL